MDAMAYLRRQLRKGKTYFSLVENVKNSEGKWRYKTISSFGRKSPTYWSPIMRQGDCIDLIKCVPSESIDLILTDPPYFLGGEKSVGEWDEFKTKSEFKTFTEKWLKESARVLRKGGVFFSFFCKFKVSLIFDFLKLHGFKTMNIFVWHKTNGNCYNPKLSFAERVEVACVLYKMGQAPTFNNNGTVHPNIYALSTHPSNSKERNMNGYHPTEKPIKLIEHILSIFSKEDDIVLDPFSGKGTVAAAAFKNMRKTISFEKDSYFFKAATQRISAIQSKFSPFEKKPKIKGLLL